MVCKIPEPRGLFHAGAANTEPECRSIPCYTAFVSTYLCNKDPRDHRIFDPVRYRVESPVEKNVLTTGLIVYRLQIHTPIADALEPYFVYRKPIDYPSNR